METALHNHAPGENKSIFGFWIYIMTDLIMFAALFAAYIVLRGNTFGGPSGSEIFNLTFALIQTLILLTSSFTCGLAMLGIQSGSKKNTYIWYSATFLLGLLFLILEIVEFAHLFNEGLTYKTNAFMSAFFTLLGAHGLHILIGLLWILVGLFMVHKKGLTNFTISRLLRLNLFWHFLDIVWIFIFTFVYLMSGIS